MRSGLGIFLGFGVARGGGGAAPATLTIGAETLVGAGGRSVAVADGTYGPYTVASGILTPNTTPVTPGDYTVGALTVTAEADVFDCGTGQLAAIIALGSAALDGKTIKGTPAADIGGAAIGDQVTFGTGIVIPAGLLITSRDTSDPCSLRRCMFRQDGTITLREIIWRDFYQLADSFLSTAIGVFGNPGAGRSGLTLDRVEGYSNDPSAFDTSSLLSGVGAATAAGTVITLTGSPDLSGILADRSMAIRVSTSVRTITGVDNTAKTITVNQSVTVTAADYDIGYVPQTLYLIGQEGGYTSYPDLAVLDCDLHDYHKAIFGTFRSFEFNGPTFDRGFGDHLSIGITGAETKGDVIRCVFGRLYGIDTGPTNPHPDIFQINATGMTTDNTVPYRFIGNIAFGGPDAGMVAPQGYFIGGTPSGRRVLIEAEHNIYLGQSSGAIFIQRAASGSIIRGNTLLLDDRDMDEAPQIPTIRLDYEDDGVIVEYNVVPSISETDALLAENFTFGSTEGLNAPSYYAAVMAGVAADFNSENLTTAAQVRAAVTPDTTALLPVGKTRIGAMTGYYDYATGASDAPWDEAGWSADVDWGNLTDVAVSTAVESDLVQITGVSATGATIGVSGGQAATLSLYDTDGTTLIASGVSSVCALNNQWVKVLDTSSGSGSTLSTITITAGAAASGTWTFETEAGAATLVLSEYREAGGFTTSLTLAVGPTAAGDEILVFVCMGGVAQSPSIANFDQLQSVDYGTSSRFRAFRWNGGGSRPNNSNVTITTAGAANMRGASVVIPAATYIGSSSGSTSAGTSHTTGTVTSDAGMTACLIMGNGDTGVYSITGPTPVPAAITAPHSTDVDEATAIMRQSGSVGSHLAFYQHDGPTTDAVTITTGAAQTSRWIVVAFEPT